jgi:hypothetical protein
MSDMNMLGWPLPKRLDHFLALRNDRASAPGTFPVDFQGQRHHLPIWRVPIALPKYRLLNGRTASLQQEWLADNLGHGDDFFTRDPESAEAQKAQHELLRRLIEDKDLLPHFENTENKQKLPLIVDNKGFVVNGNRRLCTWRVLLTSKEGQKYSHFANIDVVVLPTADETAIDELEAELQFTLPTEADYSWHTRANMYELKMRARGWDEKTLADFYKITRQELKTLLDMRNYAAQYLRSRGKENHWSLVTDKRYAFEKMVERRRHIDNAGQKALFEATAFSLIDDPRGGRLYESIPDLHKYFDKVRERLLEDFPVKDGQEAVKDDLLGGSSDEARDFALAKRVDDENVRAQVAETTKDVIDTQRSLDREKDSAQYVLKRLQKANAELQSAVAGIKATTSRQGVEEQIAAIERSLTALKRWLQK